MKMFISTLLALALLCSCASCQKEELHFTQGDIRIEVKTGEHWLHDFPLLLGISKKNPPQFAIWMEDTAGNYLTTIFATYKIATEGWVSNGGNRRKEALPYWCHKRGIVYPDGLMLPTKSQPLTDGITGATPTGDQTIQVRLKELSLPVVIKAEFNHSLDFNDNFPKDASSGNANYSGGKMGSGQPAVVYSGTLYPNATTPLFLTLIGHSSPDGSSGNLYTDMDKLTTAKSIVSYIKVEIVK